MAVMKVLETITKNDEAAGCFLIDAVVYDYLADVAKEYEEDLREVYSLWALDRVQVAKRALGRKYVADMVAGEYPGDDVAKAASWLAGIERFIATAATNDVSKAMTEYFDIDGKQVQRSVSRDARGRFARGVNQNKSTKLRDVAGQPDRISPTLKGYFDGNLVPFGDLDDLDRKAAEKHQGQWDQVTQIVSGFSRDFKGSEKAVDVAMEIKDNDTGEIRSAMFPLSRFKQQDGASGPNSMPDLRELKPLTNETILSVSLIPGRNASDKDVARLATYNSLGSIGGQALASLANTSDDRLGNLRDALRMPGTGDKAPQAGLGRLFGLLGAGGAVLEESIGSNKATKMARFVGAMGPQAEEVLSPYVRRAAYRYRGTEVKPSTALNPATMDPNIERSLAETQVVDRNGGTRTVGTGLTGDALKQQAIADNASLYLATTLPKDPILARLSEASGQVLPSRGVIYDADGKPVTEAVGFTDDHYLPFDLKNLGALRGGQYVRTRVTGGLTGEDVYAAIMTGARNVQVVSESGVFTLEFQPDFRGARANSDKARGMYDRYLKILDAVDKSGLYLQDLPPQKIREIKQQAKEQARYGGDADDIERELMDQARDEMDDLTDGELRSVAAQAYKVATGMDITAEDAEAAGNSLTGRKRRAFDESFEEIEQTVRASKVNRLRLNGEGYATALKTLEAQFPQFIRRTDRRPLSALGKEAGRDMPKTRQFATDRGYVSPGGLRADTVRSGFYRTGNINPPSKPNAPVSGRSASTAAVASTTDKAPTATTETATDTAPADNVPTKGAENRVRARQERFAADFKRQAQELAGDLALLNDGIDSDAADTYSTTSFESMSSPQRRAMWLVANIDGDRTIEALTNKATRADAIAALSDKRYVSAAFDSLMNESDMNALGTVNIGGTEMDTDEAVSNLTDRAMRLADIAALSTPFAQPASDVKSSAFHTGLAPQRFADIAVIGEPAQLEAYSSKNPEIAEIARSMTSKGIGSIGANVSRQVSALKQVAEARSGGLQGTNPTTYVDRSVFETAYPGKTFDMEALRNVDPQHDALVLQKAWTLAVTAKLLEGLGDDLPKAGAADGPLKKSAPIVKMLSPEHPLSKAVAARVAKGLPPLASTGTR